VAPVIYHGAKLKAPTFLEWGLFIYLLNVSVPSGSVHFQLLEVGSTGVSVPFCSRHSFLNLPKCNPGFSLSHPAIIKPATIVAIRAYFICFPF
jgi:hypothetical protein